MNGLQGVSIPRMLSIVEYLTPGPDTGISEQVQRIDRLEVKGVLQEYIPAMTLRTYFDHQLAKSSGRWPRWSCAATRWISSTSSAIAGY